jgi:hypothetical protein
MVGRGEVRRTLAGLTAAKSDETATVGQGGCYRRIRERGAGSTARLGWGRLDASLARATPRANRRPMLEPVVFPLPIRVLNSLSSALHRATGLDTISLDPDNLAAAAARKAGCSDFGSDEFRDALDVLCASADRDAHLNLVGRMMMREHIVSALATRLLLVEARRTRPEVFEAELVPPLIVVGLPRSGSTFLHRLLSIAPGARALPFWLLRRPLPLPGKDRRRSEIVTRLKIAKKFAPQLDAKHFVEADSPEECFWLLDPSLRSLTFWVNAPVYGYVEWLAQQDMRPAYATYREMLQLIQADTPGARLTLKAPAHTPWLAELLEAIPTAHIVQTHRDPLPVVASACSLFHTIHGLAGEVDPPRLGRVILDLLANNLVRNLAARERLGKDAVLDIQYEELLADPSATVARIHERFGLGVDDELRSCLAAEVSLLAQHKHGRHDYDLGDFGLGADEVRDAFARYTETYRAPTSGSSSS